jgi:small-conductance mechanosensitive channel
MKALHNIKEPLQELNNMIGMTELKNNIVDQILYFAQGLHKNNNSLSGDFMHTVIYGPPGTGKTEIAKMMGKIYSNIGVLNKGTEVFDPKTLDSLTADLIKYQKDYAEIEKTKDRVNTLKLIHAGTLKDLESATYWYYIYIAILIILCIIVAFQVWKVPAGGMFSWFRTPTGQG